MKIASVPISNIMNGESFWFQFQVNQTAVRLAHRAQIRVYEYRLGDR